MPAIFRSFLDPDISFDSLEQGRLSCFSAETSFSNNCRFPAPTAARLGIREDLVEARSLRRPLVSPRQHPAPADSTAIAGPETPRNSTGCEPVRLQHAVEAYRPDQTFSRTPPVD
jgi:hypothetical protein